MKKTIMALITLLLVLFTVTALATSYPAKGKTGYDSVNVRESTSTSSKRVGKIYAGTTYNIKDEKKSADGTVWYLVEYESGNYGYVASKYIKITQESATTPAPETAAVSDDDENGEQSGAASGSSTYVVEEEVDDEQMLPDESKSMVNWLKKTYLKKQAKAANLYRYTFEKENGKTMRFYDQIPDNRYGIVAADIRDWDGDGQLELLTIEWQKSTLDQTITGKVTGETGACLVYDLKLIRYADKQGTVLDEIQLGEIGADYYGTTMIGAQKYNNILYIYGSSSWKNETSSYHSPVEFCHVENGKFVLDCVDGTFVGFSGNANEKMSCPGLEWKNTPLQSAIGAKGSTLVSITMDWYDLNGSYDYSITDYSGFQNWNGGNTWTELSLNAVQAWRDWQAAQAAEANRLEGADESAAMLSSLLSSVSSSSGIELTSKAEYIHDGVLTLRYAAPAGSVITITYDSVGGLPIMVRLSAESSAVTNEWIALKDALIKSGIGGVVESSFTALEGNPNTDSASQSAGSITMEYGNIGNWVFLIHWN